MSGVLRAVSGTLAGGLVALTLVLAVATVLAVRAGVPGPGAGVLAGHAVAAAVAVLAQRRADRDGADRDGGVLAALAVVGLTGVVLAAFWLG